VALKFGERDSLTASVPAFARSVPDRAAANIRVDGPAVQLISRDAFVVETSNKIEQLQASLRLMARQVSELSQKVVDVEETAQQEHRWHAYQETERRAREAKFDELLRSYRDLKGRLDRIEPRGGGDFHVYNSFEAVSRKLSELDAFRDDAQRVERNVTLRAWLLCGAVTLAATILVASNVLTG
jgi:vacuolar-type H+-ATPase subunit I/STV1